MRRSKAIRNVSLVTSSAAASPRAPRGVAVDRRSVAMKELTERRRQLERPLDDAAITAHARYSSPAGIRFTPISEPRSVERSPSARGPGHVDYSDCSSIRKVISDSSASSGISG